MTSPTPELNVGFNHLAALTMLEIGPDGGRVQVHIDHRHHQPWGIVHGGLYCTLVETVASFAATAWWQSTSEGTCVGVNNNTDFLRPVTEGLLTATATPIHRGRRQQLWLVVVTDQADRAVARGQVRLQNLPPAEPPPLS